MATTDANGIVQFTNTDPISNLPVTLNTLGSSVSSAITDVRDDLIYKASSATDATAKKNTLAAAGITGTVSNPLMFYRTDEKVIYKWDGSAWADALLTPRVYTLNTGSFTVNGGQYVAKSISYTNRGSIPMIFTGMVGVNFKGYITTQNATATGVTIRVWNDGTAVWTGSVNVLLVY